MPANIDERDEMGLEPDPSKAVDDGTREEGAPEDSASGPEEASEETPIEEPEEEAVPEEAKAEAEPPAPAPAPAVPAAAIPEWAERIISDLAALKMAQSQASQPAAAPTAADPWGEDFEGALAEAMNDSSGRKFKSLIRSLAKQEVEEVRSQLGNVTNEMVTSRWRSDYPHLTAHVKDVAALVERGIPLAEASELVEARNKVGRWAPPPVPAAPPKPAAPPLDQQKRMVEQRRAADGPRPTRKPQGVVVERQGARDTRTTNVENRRFDLSKRGFLSDLAELQGKLARGGGDED